MFSRRSGVGSVSASRSPLPLVSRDTIPRQPFLSSTIHEGISPQSSVSPSPQKRSKVPRSPNTEKKHKRRRESGILLPRLRQKSPEGTIEGQVGIWEDFVPRDTSVMATQPCRGKKTERSPDVVAVKDTAVSIESLRAPKSHAKWEMQELTPNGANTPSRKAAMAGKENSREGQERPRTRT